MRPDPTLFKRAFHIVIWIASETQPKQSWQMWGYNSDGLNSRRGLFLSILLFTFIVRHWHWHWHWHWQTEDNVDLKIGILINRVCMLKFPVVEAYFSCNTTHTELHCSVLPWPRKYCFWNYLWKMQYFFGVQQSHTSPSLEKNPLFSVMVVSKAE